VTLDGIVLVDKPEGPTSHDVVAMVRKIFNTRKVGHAGTLDPMATGMLVIGVGRATRLLGHLTLSDKEYVGTIRLGIATDTDDAQGHVTSTATCGSITDEKILEVVRSFRGHISQRPSSVSAIKVDGKRAYARVRQGEEVELKPRDVTVHDLEILSIVHLAQVDCVDVSVRVVCSAGTYIRALARDIGKQLGVGGHLTSLRRTRSGLFTTMSPLDALRETPKMLDLDEAMRMAFPCITLEVDDAIRARHGVRVPAPVDSHSGIVGVFNPDGHVVSLGRVENGEVFPVVVFAE